jgi:hypothetical protein
MHMTLCPYSTGKSYFWKALLTHSAPTLIDLVYLQCYDGGTYNTPGQWQGLLSATVPIFPILNCHGSFGVCYTTRNSMSPDSMKITMKNFKIGYPALTGGAIWQMADVNSYIQMNCAIIDPGSGTAIRVRQYLLQLAAALRAPH